MPITSTTSELLLSVHGIEIRFVTNSPELMDSVEALLNYFSSNAVGPHAARMQFDAVDDRRDIPVLISSETQLLYSGSGLATGPERQTTWRCDMYSKKGLLIADFHDEGLVVIDGTLHAVQGYLVRPESMAPDSRVSFVHFAMTELLKRRGLYTFHATALEHNGRGVLIRGLVGVEKPHPFSHC